jgi:hypothetical protein
MGTTLASLAEDGLNGRVWLGNWLSGILLSAELPDARLAEVTTERPRRACRRWPNWRLQEM